MVLHRKHKTDGMHKLSSPWEGPYIVKAVTRPGSYRLYDQDGVDILTLGTSNTLGVSILETFYKRDVPFMYICISIMISSVMLSPFVFSP